MQKCAICGKDFIQNKNNQIYCSTDCGHTANILDKRSKRRREKLGLQTRKSNATITKFREQEGLRPIVAGRQKCMNCERVFWSKDLVSNRMCLTCRAVATVRDNFSARTAALFGSILTPMEVINA
jgi:hypothetical protein